jgi:hypothetical protein
MFCRSEWKQERFRGRVVAKVVRAIAIALGFVAGMPTAASAWGSEGHRLVAEVAQGQLTAAARAEIDRLLALEPRVHSGIDLDLGRRRSLPVHRLLALRQLPP